MGRAIRCTCSHCEHDFYFDPSVHASLNALSALDCPECGGSGAVLTLNCEPPPDAPFWIGYHVRGINDRRYRTDGLAVSLPRRLFRQGTLEGIIGNAPTRRIRAGAVATGSSSNRRNITMAGSDRCGRHECRHAISRAGAMSADQPEARESQAKKGKRVGFVHWKGPRQRPIAICN